jgi:REP element-mobilizing transposase RayT
MEPKDPPKKPQAPRSRGPRYGYRAPSGRPVGPNPRVHHRSREDVDGVPCHVTMKVRRAIGSIRAAPIRREIERSFAELEGRAGFAIEGFAFADDHIHAIVRADDARTLRSGMSGMTARFGRAVNRVLGRSGPVLEDRFHLEPLATPTALREARELLALGARQRAAVCRTLRCGRPAHA